MTIVKELPGAAKPDTAPAPAITTAVKDRRRPGRPEDASPHLIPLLRTAEIDVAAFDMAEELPFEEDALAPAKGIVIGLMLSIPVWAVIGMIVWAVL